MSSVVEGVWLVWLVWLVTWGLWGLCLLGG